MAKRARSSTVKSILEQHLGKPYREMLSNEDKVAIMEYMLQCPYNEVVALRNTKLPAFIVVCAVMVEGQRLPEFMSVLELCRRMAAMK